eukprot:gnl/TRDRNA2_/TRDRNA2_172801_c1_seq4.p1 gnl/TRDRNA2_/TRDRNA2_172801_c1~~gnl/TRDRNA2_/TRDRNA2_172801_c1_seq4.p1  ORF type:complete len:498 (-),score=50.35 gnl/TRDRNA2_/TRDRNA2_172801_c1_seq4:14-1507(-)
MASAASNGLASILEVRTSDEFPEMPDEDLNEADRKRRDQARAEREAWRQKRLSNGSIPETDQADVLLESHEGPGPEKRKRSSPGSHTECSPDDGRAGDACALERKLRAQKSKAPGYNQGVAGHDSSIALVVAELFRVYFKEIHAEQKKLHSQVESWRSFVEGEAKSLRLENADLRIRLAALGSSKTSTSSLCGRENDRNRAAATKRQLDETHCPNVSPDAEHGHSQVTHNRQSRSQSLNDIASISSCANFLSVNVPAGSDDTMSCISAGSSRHCGSPTTKRDMACWETASNRSETRSVTSRCSKPDTVWSLEQYQNNKVLEKAGIAGFTADGTDHTQPAKTNMSAVVPQLRPRSPSEVKYSSDEDPSSSTQPDRSVNDQLWEIASSLEMLCRSNDQATLTKHGLVPIPYEWSPEQSTGVPGTQRKSDSLDPTLRAARFVLRLLGVMPWCSDGSLDSLYQNVAGLVAVVCAIYVAVHAGPGGSSTTDGEPSSHLSSFS